ncbi:RmlC-like cupin domain-containing protein [Boeremia exigua]|uniref:RmlC-like cupin domain-containing protein n=1 Tax=Boeremia exigua TaxID=749465 RepID=UPI001E8EEDA8|nr:RmlC-like cupin domain-containing protein [Boeremia exigua]KAH6644491.1 RmlC-like cupin domain-containing protein [Boeremia exigua]
MDEEARQALASMEMPRRPINYVPAKEGEILKLGHVICRIMEDGSRTDNRIGSAEFTLPPKTGGPPAHWHEMHDETFLVTQGTVRFHAPDNKHIDAHVGDYITVPIRAPHTFSNPFEQEAKFFNTYTPAFYIDYFRILAQLGKDDEKMSKEKNLEVMGRFATIPAQPMLKEMSEAGK